MGTRRGAKYLAVKRFDALMADGVKRSEAKAEAQARGESLFAFTDQRIHAFETRENYQNIVMRVLVWCRDEHNLRDLTLIDTRADELASRYLMERVVQGYSAWTLQTERSALRMFFQKRDLAAGVVLPTRKRKNIKRSRQPALRDHNINLENWQHVIQFCLACGLRREELRDLRVCDVFVRSADRQLVVRVVKGKGGKQREVSVFPGREQAVLNAVAGKEPDAHVFGRLSSLLDIHSYRRQFARDLYEHLSGKPVPPVVDRLCLADLDPIAILQVSRCLGHNRLDVVINHYLQ
jgi:integrase